MSDIEDSRKDLTRQDAGEEKTNRWGRRTQTQGATNVFRIFLTTAKTHTHTHK